MGEAAGLTKSRTAMSESDVPVIGFYDIEV